MTHFAVVAVLTLALGSVARADEAYSGTYKVADNLVYKITRAGDDLGGSLHGAPRRVGQVIGFVSRREGHDLVFKRVG